jgi:signal transduction histidine kinase
MRLYQRLLLTALCLSIIPLLALTTQLFWDANLSRQEARESHRTMVRNFSVQVEDFFQNLDKDLGFIASFEQRPDMSSTERQGVLLSAISNRNDFDALLLLDTDGKTLSYAATDRFQSQAPANYASQNEFKEAVRTGSLQLSPPMISGGKTLVFVYYPLSYGPVVFMAVRLDRLLDRLRSVRMGETGAMWLTGPRGEMLLTPPDSADIQTRVGKALESSVGDPEIKDIEIGRLTGAKCRIPRFEWTLAFLQDRAEAFRAARRMDAGAILWLSAGLIAILIGSWTFATDLIRPIKRLSDAAVKISEGNLDIQIPPQGPAELTRLLATFNSMVRRLRDFQDMQVERMLEEKTKLEAVVQGISDGILIEDFQGRVIFSNQRARELLGTKLQLPPAAAQDIQTVMSKKTDQRAFSTEILSEDDKKRIIHGLAVRLAIKPGKDLGVMIVLEDVTLDHKIQQLREDFLNMFSHDLRAPLTALQAYIQMLLDSRTGTLVARQKTLLQQSDQATRDLIEMVSNILDAQKYEQGEIHLEIDPVPIVKLLDDIRERQAFLFQFHQINFHILPDDGAANTMVEADRNLLERVLNNLLGNAAKFTLPGGTVKLAAALNGAKVLFSVEDNGRGIPAEKIPQLFQKYKQTESADRLQGSGLGLFICRMIIEAHGGQIAASSELHKGSRFEFWLPLKQPPVGSPPTPLL